MELHNGHARMELGLLDGGTGAEVSGSYVYSSLALALDMAFQVAMRSTP